MNLDPREANVDRMLEALRPLAQEAASFFGATPEHRSPLRPRLARALRTHGPHGHRGELALTGLQDDRPDTRSWYPVRAFQLVGGRDWSLALIRGGPLSTDTNRAPSNP